MTHIPSELLREILIDPWYKTCCLKDNDCEGRIEFHHAFEFQGKQVNEPWCIVPICSGHHEDARIREVKDMIDYIILNRAPITALTKYSKAENLFQRLFYLENKFHGKRIRHT